MRFTSPQLVAEAIWALRLGDLPRATNRASINRLMNGSTPYTEKERQENNIELNVNFLDGPQLVADARRSLYQAFQAPGKFFTVTVPYGPPYARMKWGRKITEELKRTMKGSRLYAECLDSQAAGVTLHGIGPAVWLDRDRWCPEEKGIEDILIPGGTLRSLRNLDYFAVYYQYTAEQLYRLTHGPKVDKAWNVPMADAAIKWAQEQKHSQLSYSDLFAPEKVEERFKGDLGFYGTDRVATVDFWKFFYHEDRKGSQGWRMRMVLDTPANYDVGTGSENSLMPKQTRYGTDQGEWLYDPGDRLYGSSVEELIHFQFGDLSAVSPFRYHSIRGLGHLLYALCHLQNRTLCKYYEGAIEAMNQYFRGNEGDQTRVQKVDLVNFGFVPEGLAFVRPEERWKIDPNLSEQAIRILREKMEYSAAQYRQGRDMGTPDKEKTATQVMAEVNSAMSMVGTLLTQAYRYQTYQYREICRRFCKENSRDPEVRSWRARVLKAGVPENILDHTLWEIEPERAMGGGNKTLQLAMAQSLLEMRPLLDPDSQRMVDRIVIGARTDNDELAVRLVPEVKPPSLAAHDAANSFGTLMLGGQVPLANGMNHVDVIETLLSEMGAKIQSIEQAGGQTDMKELGGLQNVAQHIQQHLMILSQNKDEKQRVRQYAQQLGQLMNMVKAYAQRLQQAMKKQAEAQAQSQNGGDPQAMAKMQSQVILAQQKAKSAEESHAQRTAQRQISFEADERRKDAESAAQMQRDDAKAQAELRMAGMQHSQDMVHSAMETDQELAAQEELNATKKKEPSTE